MGESEDRLNKHNSTVWDGLVRDLRPLGDCSGNQTLPRSQYLWRYCAFKLVTAWVAIIVAGAVWYFPSA